MIFDDNGRITYQSLGMTEMFRGEAVPDNLPELMSLATPEIRDELTAHLLTADAKTPPSTFQLAQLIGDPSRTESLELWVSDLRSDPLVDGRLVTGRDVTAEVELKAQLESRALLDALTGLPNRWSLINLMEAQNGPITLLMIDLDGFKQTNDVLGHSAGDQMLRAVARRFMAALGDCDSKLFRLGGDEFAVVIDATDLIVAQRTARELLSTLTTAVRLDQGFESLRASIGIAMSSPIQTDPDEVLKHADIALYAAKAAGGNQFKVFEADMEIAATERRDLSLALEAADVDSDFRLVFQPLVDAESGRITHLEALLRWTSPTLGFVPPDVFIPAAETSGKIVPLGQFVLAQACGQLAELRAEGLAADVGMTVNISPRQLDQPGFVGRVLALLSHHKLVPGDLTIEVTETVLFREAELGIEQLHELKNSGCHIAVDDFGSGYSNLGRLLEMPLDMIKVDRSLVVTLVEMREKQGGSPEGPCQVMSAIRTIGDAIGAPIVAEGIETEEQWHSMRDSGVQLLQGYLFSKPLEATDVAEIVRNGVPVAPQRVLTS